MVFVQVVHEQFEVYALNVYVKSYNRKRKFIRSLQEWLLQLVATKPQAIFLIAGDFNSKVQPVEHLAQLCQPGAHTFQRVIRGKLVQSRTDWVLCSRHNLTHTTEHLWYDCSDHCAFASVLEVPNQQPKASHVKFPCAQKALELCMRVEQECETTDEFFQRHREEALKQGHMKKVRLTLRQ